MNNTDLTSKFDPKLLEIYRSLLKNPDELDLLLETTYASRNAADMIFAVSAEQSVTGKSVAVVAAREHLAEESEYVPHAWNLWPDVVPPRLDTEPYIEGKPQECDYWLVKLRGGRFITAKLTRQKNWVQISENLIESYREFSPRPSAAWLDSQVEPRENDWNAYPKFIPVPGTYEVLLTDGRERAVTWKDGKWSFYADEIAAFKKII